MNRNSPGLFGRKTSGRGTPVRPISAAAAVTIAAVTLTPQVSLADEGGVSFWLPGIFGSLAAVPQQPGWSLTTIYYHTSVSAGGDVGLAREVTIGRSPQVCRRP